MPYSPDRQSLTGGNISEESMKEMVKKGQKIAKAISSGKSPSPDANDVVNLSWYLMALAANQDKVFTNGAFRIDDPKGHLFNFLKNVKVEGQDHYVRDSTHMKGVRTEGEVYGLDFPHHNLSAGKRTIHFIKLQDGTIYLKFELYGYPPFWKKGYRTLTNFLTAMGHVLTFLKTRVYKKGDSKFPTYKEKIPSKVKKQFEKVVKVAYGVEEKSIFQKIGDFFLRVPKPTSEIAAEMLIKQGKARGFKYINDQLTTNPLFKGKSADHDYQDLYNNLYEKITYASQIGYTKEFKGDEVLIPLY